MKQVDTTFLFYFETENHYITKDEFIQALTTSSIIFENLNTDILGEKFHFKIVVLPPENGSLKQIIGVFVLTSIFAAPIGEVSTGFLSGLLGKDLKEYATDAGAFARDYLKKILSTKTNELENIIPPQINIDKSIKTKSDFYKLLLNNEEIKGIKYSEEDEGIKRDKFVYYIAQDIIRELNELFEYKELEIYKPILKEEKDGKWGFFDTVNREYLNCKMKDEEFKKKVFNGNLPLKESKTPDKIKCKMNIKREMRNGEIKILNTSITEVYTFNNAQLKETPEGFVVGVLLPVTRKKINTQLSLWDLREK